MQDLKSIATIPNINSTDEQWISWHKTLKRELGKFNANDTFMRAWNQRKNESALFGSKANTSKLREYLKKEGVSLSGDGYLGFAYDALDTLDDWASSAFNTYKWVLLILLIVIIIPVFVLMMSVARNPDKIVSAVVR